MRSKYQQQKSETGQSLVELAVSLTFAILLFSGVIDLGRAFFTFISLRDAAEEGALYGSYDPLNETGIKDRIRLSSDSPINLETINPSDITITTTPDKCPGSTIKVKVSYRFDLTMPLLGAVVGGEHLPINAEVINTILSSTASGCS